MTPERELRFLNILAVGLKEAGAPRAALDLQALANEVAAELYAPDRLCVCEHERFKHEKGPDGHPCRGLRVRHNDGMLGASPCPCSDFKDAT